MIPSASEWQGSERWHQLRICPWRLDKGVTCTQPTLQLSSYGSSTGPHTGPLMSPLTGPLASPHTGPHTGPRTGPRTGPQKRLPCPHHI